MPPTGRTPLTSSPPPTGSASASWAERECGRRDHRNFWYFVTGIKITPTPLPPTLGSGIQSHTHKTNIIQHVLGTNRGRCTTNHRKKNRMITFHSCYSKFVQYPSCNTVLSLAKSRMASFSKPSTVSVQARSSPSRSPLGVVQHTKAGPQTTTAKCGSRKTRLFVRHSLRCHSTSILVRHSGPEREDIPNTVIWCVLHIFIFFF